MKDIDIKLKNFGLTDMLGEMSQVFKEIILNFIVSKEKFPILYLLSKIDYKTMDNNTQIEFASVLTYLQLVWIDNRFWPNIRHIGDYLSLCEHVFNSFKANIKMTQKFLAMFTLNPLSKFHSFLVQQESPVDWEKKFSKNDKFGQINFI